MVDLRPRGGRSPQRPPPGSAPDSSDVLAVDVISMDDVIWLRYWSGWMWGAMSCVRLYRHHICFLAGVMLSCFDISFSTYHCGLTIRLPTLLKYLQLRLYYLPTPPLTPPPLSRRPSLPLLRIISSSVVTWTSPLTLRESERRTTRAVAHTPPSSGTTTGTAARCAC